jgi:glycosyltransferase involved in cell wall biosynthesis
VSAASEVSVIVPVRDGERYIGEAIDSILAQTAPPSEVLVVDDGSRDGTAAIVSRYEPPVRCIRRDRAGAAQAINDGLAQARGDAIAFLDADDVWAPRKLELQLAALEREPELDLVFGHVEQFHSPELDERERARLHGPPGTTPGLLKGAMLARRRAFEAVGPFDGEFPPAEFIDWYARAEDAGLRGEMLPEVVLHRRLHGANLTLRSDRDNYARVVRRIMLRRQAGAP